VVQEHVIFDQILNRIKSCWYMKFLTFDLLKWSIWYITSTDGPLFPYRIMASKTQLPSTFHLQHGCIPCECELWGTSTSTLELMVQVSSKRSAFLHGTLSPDPYLGETFSHVIIFTQIRISLVMPTISWAWSLIFWLLHTPQTDVSLTMWWSGYRSQAGHRQGEKRSKLEPVPVKGIWCFI
jgi:hypothetical protein